MCYYAADIKKNYEEYLQIEEASNNMTCLIKDIKEEEVKEESVSRKSSKQKTTIGEDRKSIMGHKKFGPRNSTNILSTLSNFNQPNSTLNKNQPIVSAREVFSSDKKMANVNLIDGSRCYRGSTCK